MWAPSGTRYGPSVNVKRQKGKCPTEKVRKENVQSVSLPSNLGAIQTLSSSLVQDLGRVSGSDYVDDDHKQTRSWIWICSVCILERHWNSTEKTQWLFFVSPTNCGPSGGWCQSNLCSRKKVPSDSSVDAASSQEIYPLAFPIQDIEKRLVFFSPKQGLFISNLAPPFLPTTTVPDHLILRKFPLPATRNLKVNTSQDLSSRGSWYCKKDTKTSALKYY